MTRDQHPQGQAAHQHPHHLEGRGGAPDPPIKMTLEKGAGLYRGRRTGRSDPEIDSACARKFLDANDRKRAEKAKQEVA